MPSFKITSPDGKYSATGSSPEDARRRLDAFLAQEGGAPPPAPTATPTPRRAEAFLPPLAQRAADAPIPGERGVPDLEMPEHFAEKGPLSLVPRRPLSAALNTAYDFLNSGSPYPAPWQNNEGRSSGANALVPDNPGGIANLASALVPVGEVGPIMAMLKRAGAAGAAGGLMDLTQNADPAGAAKEAALQAAFQGIGEGVQAGVGAAWAGTKNAIKRRVFEQALKPANLEDLKAAQGYNDMLEAASAKRVAEGRPPLENRITPTLGTVTKNRLARVVEFFGERSGARDDAAVATEAESMRAIRDVFAELVDTSAKIAPYGADALQAAQAAIPKLRGKVAELRRDAQEAAAAVFAKPPEGIEPGALARAKIDLRPIRDSVEEAVGRPFRMGVGRPGQFVEGKQGSYQTNEEFLLGKPGTAAAEPFFEPGSRALMPSRFALRAKEYFGDFQRGYRDPEAVFAVHHALDEITQVRDEVFSKMMENPKWVSRMGVLKDYSGYLGDLDKSLQKVVDGQLYDTKMPSGSYGPAAQEWLQNNVSQILMGHGPGGGLEERMTRGMDILRENGTLGKMERALRAGKPPTDEQKAAFEKAMSDVGVPELLKDMKGLVKDPAAFLKGQAEMTSAKLAGGVGQVDAEMTKRLGEALVRAKRSSPGPMTPDQAIEVFHWWRQEAEGLSGRDRELADRIVGHLESGIDRSMNSLARGAGPMGKAAQATWQASKQLERDLPGLYEPALRAITSARALSSEDVAALVDPLKPDQAKAVLDLIQVGKGNEYTVAYGDGLSLKPVEGAPLPRTKAERQLAVKEAAQMLAAQQHVFGGDPTGPFDPVRFSNWWKEASSRPRGLEAAFGGTPRGEALLKNLPILADLVHKFGLDDPRRVARVNSEGLGGQSGVISSGMTTQIASGNPQYLKGNPVMNVLYAVVGHMTSKEAISLLTAKDEVQPILKEILAMKPGDVVPPATMGKIQTLIAKSSRTMPVLVRTGIEAYRTSTKQDEQERAARYGAPPAPVPLSPPR